KLKNKKINRFFGGCSAVCLPSLRFFQIIEVILWTKENQSKLFHDLTLKIYKIIFLGGHIICVE
ncbi:hypothetical protein K0040_20520, partial [Terrisporobacter petrolearius]|uniref:hypothetical protein n=1 Tax=Terrisporobacter petrolearius TaxID=1460447 RepID=UPI001D163869